MAQRLILWCSVSALSPFPTSKAGAERAKSLLSTLLRTRSTTAPLRSALPLPGSGTAGSCRSSCLHCGRACAQSGRGTGWWHGCHTPGSRRGQRWGSCSHRLSSGRRSSRPVRTHCPGINHKPPPWVSLQGMPLQGHSSSAPGNKFLMQSVFPPGLDPASCNNPNTRIALISTSITWTWAYWLPSANGI